jgi:CheY-like chemotaxis protein
MRESALARVLVVDDDPDFLGLLTSQIKQIPGVRVNVATSPDEAIHLLTENTYDLVVSDWALSPEQTAPDVLSHADHILDDISHEKMPVLFISGSEKVAKTLHLLRRLKHFEPVSFLLKACGPPIISSLAEQLISYHRGPREMEPC